MIHVALHDIRIRQYHLRKLRSGTPFSTRFSGACKKVLWCLCPLCSKGAFTLCSKKRKLVCFCWLFPKEDLSFMNSFAQIEKWGMLEIFCLLVLVFLSPLKTLNLGHFIGRFSCGPLSLCPCGILDTVRSYPPWVRSLGIADVATNPLIPAEVIFIGDALLSVRCHRWPTAGFLYGLR